MTDIGHFSGRALCTSNVYIDGVRVQVPSRVVAPGHVSRVLKTGLDALIDPAMIAGIETYTTGEVPPRPQRHRGRGQRVGRRKQLRDDDLDPITAANTNGRPSAVRGEPSAVRNDTGTHLDSYRDGSLRCCR